MKRILNITLIILLFVPSGLFAMSRAKPVHTSHPVADEVTGDVTVKGQGQSEWETVERGTLLLSGDVLRSGTDGQASIRFASGTLKIYTNTEIRIPTTGTEERRKDIRELEVREGLVFLDIGAADQGGQFRFETKKAHARAAEGMFSVTTTGAGTAINVYQGEIQISQESGSGARTSSLVPGSSLMLEPGDMQGRLALFDPRSVVKKYGENTFPDLDLASGLPSEPTVSADGSKDERAESLFSDSDSDDVPDRDISSAIADIDTSDEKNDGEISEGETSESDEVRDSISGVEGVDSENTLEADAER